MKTPVTIRPLQAGDFEEITTLWREVFPKNTDLSDSRESIAAFLNRNPGLSFVAGAGDRIVGAVLAGHDNRRGYIYHLGVLPGYRRLGIGAALLAEAEKALAGGGIIKVHLFVVRENRDACDFYGQVGYQRRDDIIVYSKLIPAAMPFYTIGEMRLTEIGPTAAMIEQVFDEFIAPGYAAEGVQTFKQFIQPAEFVQRALNGNFVLVAKKGAEIIGTLEMKNFNHVSLLFVAKAYHHKGIAAQLFKQALARCRTEQRPESDITVNSSPFAVPVYQRLGFAATGPEQVMNGIRFAPMSYKMERTQ